ncbi:MAG: thiamine pyrophosphate-binding protein [Deltaproteobacteria bacterium]|nr:thiamine pyrophosphate-binding protein [Deltaproteobacteria bacterium]
MGPEVTRGSVADLIAARLEAIGVRHLFGVSGANIEDLFAAVQRRRPRLQVFLAKHEHSAGTAADAYARLSGKLGVVMTTSGGAAINVASALAESKASGVSVLALVGEPPTELQGQGAFQDTSGQKGAVDALAVLRGVSTFSARVESIEALPRRLDQAVAAALGPEPGPAVLLIAKDLQSAEVDLRGAAIRAGPAGAVRAPERSAIARAAETLRTRPVVILAGDEVPRAHATVELAALAEDLNATVAVTPDARDAFDNRHRRFLGVAGAMGHPPVARAIGEAGAVLLVGTRLPLLARAGLEPLLRERPLVSIGRAPPFVTSAEMIHVEASILAGLQALRGALALHDHDQRLAPALHDHDRRAAPADPETEAAALAHVHGALTSAGVLAAIDRAIPEGGVVLIDAGNTGAGGVHHLRAPKNGRWLLALGMAGMGYTFGAAIGAAVATGRRCTVIAGDGAFFMHGLEIHTAAEHGLPITYVLLNNNAHGMCLVREDLLLHQIGGHNTFHPSHLGAGLAAMFPRLWARDCRSFEALEQALTEAAAVEGPAVICAELPEVEVPPFNVFQKLLAERTRRSP